MSADERFDLLVEKYLDGALVATEETELRDLLAVRPELRARFVASLTQEAALRKVRPAELTASARFDLRVTKAKAGESPAEPGRSVSARHMGSRRLQRSARRSEIGWMPVALAASVILVATVYMAFFRSRSCGSRRSGWSKGRGVHRSSCVEGRNFRWRRT
jgi:anti-sigma factor RsiW